MLRRVAHIHHFELQAEFSGPNFNFERQRSPSLLARGTADRLTA
jgi:hypothetical protein